MGGKHSKNATLRNIIEEPPVNPLFDEEGTDLSLGSSDGQIFRVRRADILSFSTGFLDPSIAAVYPPTRPIPMSEPARVLEVLLQFMRPRPCLVAEGKSPLDGADFDTVLEAAEAAEKYKVNQSLAVFKMHLRDFVHKYPFQVLQYAINHGYGDLADEAAEWTLAPEHMNHRPQLENKTLVTWLLWREQYTQVIALLNTRPPDFHPPTAKSKSKSKPAKDCTHPQAFTPQTVLSIVFSVQGEPNRLKDLNQNIDSTEVSCADCLKAREEWKKIMLRNLQGVKKISELVSS